MLQVLYSLGAACLRAGGAAAAGGALDPRLLQVIREGDKERIVPMGEVALGWIARYLRDARPLLRTPAGRQPLCS
jgi:integrase/recombinase XerD